MGAFTAFGAFAAFASLGAFTFFAGFAAFAGFAFLGALAFGAFFAAFAFFTEGVFFAGFALALAAFDLVLGIVSAKYLEMKIPTACHNIVTSGGKKGAGYNAEDAPDVKALFTFLSKCPWFSLL